MGQATPKMCQMKEIAFEPHAHEGEWRPVDEWSEDVPGGAGACDAVPVPQRCRLCCRPGDAAQVEEVLVVHHEALQKVDFLLRHDELTECCEAPAIPECVAAVRRAKIQKRLAARLRPPASLPALPPAPQRRGPDSEEDEEGDPSDEELEASMLDDFSCSPTDAWLPESDMEARMRAGLPMWRLQRAEGTGELLREDVTLRLAALELSVIGEATDMSMPMSQILCVELPHRISTLPFRPDDALGPGLASYVLPRCSSREREPTADPSSTEAEKKLLLPTAKAPELTPEAPLGEQEVHVYVTAALRTESQSDGAHVFAFQLGQDASDFARWMRFFHRAQVLHPGAAAQIAQTAD